MNSKRLKEFRETQRDSEGDSKRFRETQRDTYNHSLTVAVIGGDQQNIVVLLASSTMPIASSVAVAAFTAASYLPVWPTMSVCAPE